MAATRESILEMVERARDGSDEIKEDRARRAERAALFLDTPGRQADPEEEEVEQPNVPPEVADLIERQAALAIIIAREEMEEVVAQLRAEIEALRNELAAIKETA